MDIKEISNVGRMALWRENSDSNILKSEQEIQIGEFCFPLKKCDSEKKGVKFPLRNLFIYLFSDSVEKFEIIQRKYWVEPDPR